MPRCPNPRCQADYPPRTVQCTNPFCQCLLPEAVVAGRYRIETLIGMGGMGAVYRASDTFELQQIALKVLSFTNSVNDLETAVERFRREARYAHQLKHRNIVPVLNFGQDGKLLYLVMPIVTGGTLKALLKPERPLATSQAQGYVNDLADAIDTIHNHPQQIIHRDIKPSNLLIHQDDGRLVVTDFGIARAMQQEKALTQRGWTVGTEHYIAPEQEHGKAEPASDIYAMGVIAYQMFTGLLPFQAIIRSQAAELPTPSSLNHALPSAIDPVILRAVDIDPAKRFGSGREFADALNTALTQVNEAGDEADNDIWTVPTISVGAGLASPMGQGSTSNANIIVRAIVPENPCGRCGRENRSTSRFCRHCGYGLDETSPLVTDVCQVGYQNEVGHGQALRNSENMLLIVQGLCNTLQPPPRPFSLFAIADGQSHETDAKLTTASLVSPSRLAIETIVDVLLPLLSTSTSTHSFIGTPDAMTGRRQTLPPHVATRLQAARQADDEMLKQWMYNATRQANQVIYHCNADYDTVMASTLASMILYKRHLYLANVGDSRAYCYRQDGGLQQLDTGQGAISASTALTLGQQHHLGVEPVKYEVEIDDLVLLCSHGLWHALDAEQVEKVLALGGDTQVLAHTLVEAANTAGGRGNMSAIVVRVQ